VAIYSKTHGLLMGLIKKEETFCFLFFCVWLFVKTMRMTVLAKAMPFALGMTILAKAVPFALLVDCNQFTS
jgi:hypothetical protein